MSIDLDEALHRKYVAEDSIFTEPQSTFEPTKVEPNVPNVNTIPGTDVSYFDCRVLPRYKLDRIVADVERVMRKYEKKHRVSVSLELVQEASAGPATSEKSEIASLLAKAVRQMTGVQPRFVGIGGQTVGNLFRMQGIPTAVWSTVDGVPHEPNEYSWVRNLIGDTTVFAAIPLLAELK